MSGRIADVPSEVVATVLAVVVVPGQEVEKHQDLVILESMKMEIPVTAPFAGTILEILVTLQQAVARGDVVVRMKEA